MSMHTQGPWIADGAQVFTNETNVAQANGYRIDRETVEANARMMAAAPELLEALRGMLALDEEHHQRGHCDDDVCAEVRKALAAIAKATGEAT